MGPNKLDNGTMMPAPPNPRRSRMRRRVLLAAVICAVIVGLVLAHHHLLMGFAFLFRVDDAAPSDALVVMLGGPGHRPIKAAKLYQDGLAPIILLAESAVDPDSGVGETEQTRELLIKHGVPAERIVVLRGTVTSTHDEARRVLNYVRSHPAIKRITVVTTAFHTARTRWIFRRVLRGTGVEVRLAAATSPNFNESDWYTKDEGMVMYFSEAIKAVYYRLVY